jgi:hypothetical protein
LTDSLLFFTGEKIFYPGMTRLRQPTLRCLWLVIFMTVAQSAFGGDSSPAAASVDCIKTGRYPYRQSTGPAIDTVFRSFLRSGKEITITYEDAPLVNAKMTCDDTLAVHAWDFHDKGACLDVSAIRSGDTLTVAGKKGKKTIQRSVPLDPSPWFQALEFSLLPFLRSEAKECSFWMIRPTDMNPFKMIARKKTPEAITVDGRGERSLEVSVSPCGIGGRFWHATVWYRTNDFKFLKSVFPRLPGTAPTVFEALDAGK